MTSGWFCEGAICGYNGDMSGSWSNAPELPGYLLGAPISSLHIPIVAEDPGYHPNHGSPSGDVTQVAVPYEVTRATIFGITNQLSVLGPGDFLYTTNPDIPHAAIIVGWGPYLTTWQDIFEFSNGNPSRRHWCEGDIGEHDVQGPQCTALSDTRSACCSIPYIIDHGNHFIGSNFAWAAGPKPYYSLVWGPPKFDNGYYVENTAYPAASDTSWEFIHIPTTGVTYSLSGQPSLILLPRFGCRTPVECATPLR